MTEPVIKSIIKLKLSMSSSDLVTAFVIWYFNRKILNKITNAF